MPVNLTRWMMLPPAIVAFLAVKLFDSSSTTILAVALLSRGLPAFYRDSRFLRTLVPTVPDETERFLSGSSLIGESLLRLD